MSREDIIDILFGTGILILIIGYVLFMEWERNRVGKMMDNSVGEKYMQLMAAFMRENRGRLTDMSENSADMEVTGTDGSKENLSIIQNEKSVLFSWTLSTESTKLSREFKFTDNETQEEIMKVLAEGISEAKKEA